MTLSHAVVQIDHHAIRVMQVDSIEFRLRKITVQRHDIAWNGGDVSNEQAFFVDVCDSLEGMSMVLVVGAETAQGRLRRYVDRHQTTLLARIIGWETIDPFNEAQLLALARRYFIAHERARFPFLHHLLSKRGGALDRDPVSAAGSVDGRRGRRRRPRPLRSSA